MMLVATVSVSAFAEQGFSEPQMLKTSGVETVRKAAGGASKFALSVTHPALWGDENATIPISSESEGAFNGRLVLVIVVIMMVLVFGIAVLALSYKYGKIRREEEENALKEAEEKAAKVTKRKK